MCLVYFQELVMGPSRASDSDQRKQPGVVHEKEHLPAAGHHPARPE